MSNAINPTPLACALSPEDMAPRLARIRELTKMHLLSHRLEGRALRLTYGSDAFAELERIVALERACCAFIDYTLIPRGEEVELVMVGPQQEGTDSLWLFSQFLPIGSTINEMPACTRRSG